MNDIINSTIAWIQEKCAATYPTIKIMPDSPLLNDNLLSSLDFLHLVFFLEEKYSIKLDVDELIPDNFETPTAIAALVERTQAAA